MNFSTAQHPTTLFTMPKKRKASGRTAVVDEDKGWGSKGRKHAPITTYADVADSEDEFHINRDKVMLDDGPDAKRRKKWQEQGVYIILPLIDLC